MKWIWILFLSLNLQAETLKVMVVDTGIELGHKEIRSHVKEKWSWDYVSNHWHGTAVASLVIKDTCPQVELISCNYYVNYPKGIEGSNACFRTAIDKNVDYVNYSSMGDELNIEEYKLLKVLSDRRVVISVATGNDGKNLTPNYPCSGSFPTCYLLPNMFLVQNINEFGYLKESSNYLKHENVRSEIGSNIEVLLPDGKTGRVSGTSFSSAIYMNKILKKRCWEMNK